jgi:hypothetical protein
VAGATGLVALSALTGCQTTQDAAARIAVRNARILDSRHPVQVSQANPDVKVLKTAVVTDGDGTAVLARFRNTGKRALNDLPVSVTVRSASGKSVRLTQRPVSYFQGHAPALAPDETATWVFTTKNKDAKGARSAKVVVGLPQKPPAVASDVPQQLQISDLKPEGHGRFEVTVNNTSGLPQYDLDVYAWAQRGGRYVGAGHTSVLHVGTGESTKVQLKLIGNPRGAQVHVSAPPTIFQ